MFSADAGVFGAFQTGHPKQHAVADAKNEGQPKSKILQTLFMVATDSGGDGVGDDAAVLLHPGGCPGKLGKSIIRSLEPSAAALLLTQLLLCSAKPCPPTTLTCRICW